MEYSLVTQGERLKDLRRELKLTQDGLGDFFNVSKQVVSNLEADRILLNNEKLVSLCENFNVNISWLLCGKGTMFNEPKESKQELKELFNKMFDERIKELNDTNRKT